MDLEKKIEKELEKIKEKDFKITDHEVKQLNQINLIYANDLEAHNKFITVGVILKVGFEKERGRVGEDGSDSVERQQPAGQGYE